ncbi:MAG: thymidine kinase [Clostridia bacterium]|nr:thymidine kinase [Clostridia bacterium]
MSKLYFKYGVMGSSKTAEALMCRFNYIQKGFNVLLLKPNIDNRFEQEDDKPKIISRIGISAECTKFSKDEDLSILFIKENLKQKIDIIIVDECQFATTEQIEQLKQISYRTTVLCYGLLTNFKTQLFEGSKRLIELADSLQEIKSVCKCGRKASVNARFVNGKLTTCGEEILIGAEESYESMCYWCYKQRLKNK